MAMVVRTAKVMRVAELGCQLDHPESILLSLPTARKRAVDIGCLAFSIRDQSTDRDNKRRLDEPKLVDVESLLPERLDLVEAILDKIATSDWTDNTTITKIIFIFKILDWCDSAGHSKVFQSPELAKNAYLEFYSYLNHKVHTVADFGLKTAYKSQLTFRELLKLKFGNRVAISIYSGISVIRYERSAPATIPYAEEVTTQVGMLADMALKLSRLVIDNYSLPSVLMINSVKSLATGSMSKPLVTERAGNVDKIYEKFNGELLSSGELVNRHCKSANNATHYVRKTEDRLEKANQNSRSPSKMRIAMLAAKAYANLFLYITGSYSSELTQFEFDERALAVGSDFKTQMRAIKLRANGLVTRYIIGRKSGMHILRKYLELRSWILDGEEFPYLFFQTSRAGQYVQLSPSFQSSFFRSCQRLFLDGNAINISPKISRKLKSVILHELDNHPEVVSKNLSHSLTTNLTYYTDQNPLKKRQEFETFWEAVHVVADLKHRRQSLTSIATGQCNDFSKPEIRDEFIAVQPTCDSQIGCLNCVNYLCHSDEEDAHKLLSLQFVIDTIRQSSAFYEQSEKLFQGIYLRLLEVIVGITNTSPTAGEMVEKTRKRVFELGQLTTFWESRLQRYELMGIL